MYIINKTKNSSSRFEEAFTAGKSVMVADKVAKILSRRLKSRVEISPKPISVKNSNGSFLQYLGVCKTKGKTQTFSLDFKVGKNEEIYSFSFYGPKNINYPERVAYLNGYNIVQVLNMIVDLFSGDYERYDEAFKYARPRVTEARQTLTDWVYAYVTEHPDYMPQASKGAFDYASHTDEFMDFIRQRYNSYKSGITAGNLQYYFNKVKEAHPELGGSGSIPVVSVNDAPPKNNPTDDLLSDEDLALWEEAINPSAIEKWEQYRNYVRLIAQRDPRSFSLIAYGMPGTGKTYDCEQILRQNGASYVKLTSTITSIEAIIGQLYLHRDDEIILFDDLDAIMSSGNRANIFKQVFTQKLNRTTGLNTTYSVTDEDGNKVKVPPTFEFTSRCIMLSNKPREFFDEAVLNRVYSIELNFTKDEVLELISAKLDRLGGSDFVDVPSNIRLEIFDLMKRFKNKLESFSLRTFEKGLQAYYLSNVIGDLSKWKVTALSFMAGK